MSLVVGKDLGSVKQEIRAVLLEIAKQHSVEIYDEAYIIDLQFTSLIYALYNKYGKRVVILIDEYDYPLLNNLEEAAFDEITDLVYNFYSPLKSEGECIRFCFLAGITRYTSNTIFSGFNNANEISEDPRYADLCGFTYDEVDRYLTPYFEKHFEKAGITSDEEKSAFRERVQEYYGGYRFVADCDVTLYNPSSLAKFIGSGCTFANY